MSKDLIVEDTKIYHSPLVQGGLEIKCSVTCIWTEEGHLVLEEQVSERYSFDNRMNDDFNELMREIENNLTISNDTDGSEGDPMLGDMDDIDPPPIIVDYSDEDE